MKTRLGFHTFLRIGSCLAIVALICQPALAQWVKVPPPAIPRLADGKPNLAAPAPRLPDGKPDFSGVWESAGGISTGNVAVSLKGQELPYQPWAKALVEQRKDPNLARQDPPSSCLPQGVPRVGAAPAPWRIIQTPKYIAILYEAFNLFRQIYLDGREISEDATPTWMGYSTGKWDGDILVVESKGFNGKTWLDQTGKPVTEALHVTERFRRRDLGHMDVQITIDDPKAYTKPWTITQEVRLLPDAEVTEFVCNENNVDLQHLPGK
jgi:hypothetical protein